MTMPQPRSTPGNTTAWVAFWTAQVLAVLKTVGVITWPWAWVLAPLWAPVLVGAVLLVVGIDSVYLAGIVARAARRTP